NGIGRSDAVRGTPLAATRLRRGDAGTFLPAVPQRIAGRASAENLSDDERNCRGDRNIHRTGGARPRRHRLSGDLQLTPGWSLPAPEGIRSGLKIRDKAKSDHAPSASGPGIHSMRVQVWS